MKDKSLLHKVQKGGLFSTAIFLTMMFSFQVVFAGNSKITVSMNSPEWNGKVVCDGGIGAVLAPINAPVISISLEPNTEIPDDFYYDFKWEKRRNDGLWETVNDENNSTRIPALDPGICANDDASGKELKLGWRLKVRSVGESEWFTSDEFTVKIKARLTVKHQIIMSNNTLNIDLNVQGGNGKRSFEWTSLSKGISVPRDQKNTEDPKGLVQGSYQVIIKDDCEEKKYVIEAKETKTK